MRIQVKGGVWKNTEDEILKAAVMKYGKNQWARISSLLVGKSAKQCKARWYEWLDPSIKKTEWSREEEEKLLHLTKIMPNQWKTIAPLVGRTAAQCLDHYEKLLDAAQTKSETLEASDDPRRLRPGEIDPNPEAKPARPDPVDMDEDEKEMLSEARARLANTKGKKAKRKAREKQLEEARRLATLQKRRELKAAGIEVARQKKKIEGIDYNAEIPFQKVPPVGFYETNFEEESQEQKFQKVLLDQIEGKRKRDIEEEARKQDAKKMKKKMDKNMPEAFMQINKLNEAENVRTRGSLMLPPPQLTERDLEDLSKMESGTFGTENLDDLELAEGAEATKALLASYSASATPARAPMRTPMGGRTPTSTREDDLLKEVRNLAALTAQQTPLMGGENPTLHPTDFSGATPKRMEMKTPNPMATPLRQQPGNQTGKDVFLTPLRTPLRDGLRLNEEQDFIEGPGVGKQFKSQLRSALSSLPAPQNEYKLMLPEIEGLEERDEAMQDGESDASELLAQRQREAEEREQERLRLRSQVLKRKELPRPNDVPKVFQSHKSQQSNPSLKAAEDIIRREMINLITHDGLAYPFKDNKIRGVEDDYVDLPEMYINQAKALLEAETKAAMQSRHPEGFSLEDFENELQKAHSEFTFFPKETVFTRNTRLTSKDKAEAMSYQFEQVRDTMVKEAGKAKKLEQKLNTYFGGYQGRCGTLLRNVQDTYRQIDQATVELQTFKQLREIERKNMPKRVEKLAEEVKLLEEREARNQARFYELKMELDALNATA
mmetsp:Transcript_20771/g.29166  ORF Transcript_20771/g.29166 Transcript_20771/m.29166 type:complete len:776 (+) Transcript_20771:102-2429(+)